MNILEDFKSFFEEYKKVWNGCDANEMSKVLSEDLEIRWAVGPEVADWGYKESCDGWRQAYEHYRGNNPKWHFTDLHITPASENEVMAMFFVTFEENGEKKDVVKLFVQRFRKEENGWKLLREYCESLSPELLVANT